MKTLVKNLIRIGIVLLVLVILLVGRYYIGSHQSVVANSELMKTNLIIKPVDRLTVTPVVESQAINRRYKTEDGLAYLLQTEQNTLLLDVGYNKKAERTSPLLYNLKQMGQRLENMDLIVISHAHVDHCGGVAIMKEKTIKPTHAPLDLKGQTIFTPVPLKCPSARVVPVNQPRLLTPSVATTGPLSVQMFATGRVYEQSLIFNVKGKGLVLVVGCGHPRWETIIQSVEKTTGMPVYAVVGGSHLYYTKVQDTFTRNLFGSSRLFCRSMTKAEVLQTVAFVKNAGVRKVYLSPHDSDAATQNHFADSFGENYQTVLVGKKIEF